MLDDMYNQFLRFQKLHPEVKIITKEELANGVIQLMNFLISKLTTGAPKGGLIAYTDFAIGISPNEGGITLRFLEKDEAKDLKTDDDKLSAIERF